MNLRIGSNQKEERIKTGPTSGRADKEKKAEPGIRSQRWEYQFATASQSHVTSL